MAKKERTLISFDWALKKLLRQKANFDILEGFLSELLRFDVKISAILESEGNKRLNTSKLNRVDLLAEDVNKSIYIIEVQYSHELEYFHRMLFATSNSTIEYISEGFDYSEVRKVFSVNLLYFQLGQGDDYVYHGTNNFKGIHTGNLLQLSPAQKEKFIKSEMYQIFPEYYIIKINNFNDISKDSLDEWIYFLKNTELPENYSAKGLKKVAEALKVSALSPKDYSAYKKHQINLVSERNVIETAKIEGLKEGEQIGLEKGALLEKQKTACNLIKLGVLNIEQIATVTGLSVQEIESLDCD